jgi:nanoRNase/pAp phosphatase (c-di-AMP/oligoRNAs hydrolase)
VVIIIFRGDGISRDVGSIAARTAAEIGSGGGHKVMGRAEFPLDAVEGTDAELFIWQRLNASLKAVRNPAAAAEDA